VRRHEGQAFALPNANIMIHQVLGGAEGQASDVEIRVKYMLKLKHALNGIISKHTGKPMEQVERDCDRDNFMSAEEAKAYGLVDQVVQSRKEIPGVEKRRRFGGGLIQSHGAPDQHHDVQFLRQVARGSPQAHLRAGRLHLRQLHHPLQKRPRPRAAGPGGEEAAEVHRAQAGGNQTPA
jgi:hypothetical protein